VIERWEALSARAQGAIAFPVATVLMFFIHIGPFDQPLGRAVGYALFWGAILTALIVIASRAERAKRLERERTREDDHSDG
jgi:hypothetical protein